MRSTILARTAGVLALGTLTVISLSGCAGQTPSAAASAAPGVVAPTAAAAAATATFKDGTYTETGDYQSPGGPESITATLTIAQNLVSAVKVVGSGGTPNAQHYQGAFASGVAGAVVGKPLADLKVGALSGSSLTPKGFDAALDKIRADAS